MAKVEVQIRSCFCCGLSMGTVLIALYCLIMYSLLTGLAAWGLSDTANYGDSSHYNRCELEAQGKINSDNRKLTFHGGQTTVIVEDYTSYHCSLGLYTEEMKYSASTRYMTLVVNIFVYVGMLLASLLLLIGIALYNQWLLVPWLIIMLVDIIRGFISTFFIFWFSHGNLARIAAGIFFLSMQFFHTSLWMIVIAKFQKIFNTRRGIHGDGRQYDPRMAPPSAYSPDMRREYYPERDQGAYYGRDPYAPRY